MRRCLLRLSARVSVIGHMGHLCCSGLCDFICFLRLFTSFPQTLQDSGTLKGLLVNAKPNDLTIFSTLANLFVNGSHGFLFSSTPQFSPVRYVRFSLRI